MKTTLVPEQVKASEAGEKADGVAPVDWRESEWFKVWLKLARHEEEGVAAQEAAC